MKSMMFSERSPPSHYASRKEQARPDRAASRRRKMALMKYASEHNRSTSSMTRTREHAKQIAMKLDGASPRELQSSSTFADFGSAFPDNDPGMSKPAETKLFEPNFDSAASDFFEEDPFAPGARERFAAVASASASRRSMKSTTAAREESTFTAATQGEHHFATDWPSEDQSMHTMPSNSSMQAKFVQRSGSVSHQQRTDTPERRQGSPFPSSGPSTPVNNSGALARRRLRTQLRQSKPSYHRAESDYVDKTPPASPHSLKRYHSSDSVGSRSRIMTDHVAHYSMSANRQRPMGSANSSTNRSTASSTSSSDPHLFDPSNPDGGLTFDAFGLDATQINREVSEAMKDISDLSFFMDQDPSDSFAVGRWDSPPGSRSSTPAQEEQDGFVDGFRVNKPLSLPINVRQSPSSTERSSLTSEGSHGDVGRVNLFKEKAGFQSSTKTRKVVHPERNDNHAGLKRRQYTMSCSSPERRRMPTMPGLDDKKSMESPRSRTDVEFFDEDQSSGSGPTFGAGLLDAASRPLSDAGARSDIGPHSDVGPTSDVGPPSDVGVTSDVGVASDIGVSSDVAVNLDFSSVPLEVKSKQKKGKASSGDTYRTESTSMSSQEEKKEEDKSVGNIRSRWESREASPKMPREPKQPKPLPLPRSQISRLQAQLGDDIFSPEKFSQGGDGLPLRIPQQRTPPSSPPRRFGSFDREDGRHRPSNVAKSEGGAAIRRSHGSAVLNKLQKKPSDVKSDSGASPTFYGVKLRKTGLSMEADSPPSPPVPNRVEPRFERESDKNEESIAAGLERRAESGSENVKPRQLTYRQRRESELQKQEEERLRTVQEKTKAPERDVQTLIKRRIAANKKQSQSSSQVTARNDTNATRDDVKPVFLTELDVSGSELEDSHMMSQDEDVRLPSQESPQRSLPGSPRRRQESDLVIETDRTAETMQTTEPSAGIARMLLLQQLQQKEPTKPQTKSTTTPPKSKGFAKPSVVTSDTTSVASGDDHVRSAKGTTPKATKMMLNAFLAGRESITSADSASSLGGDGAEGTELDESVAGESKSHGENHGLPALKDDPKYERFFKMLSVGLPMEAVKHAMIRDGLDPSVMDGDHNKPVGVPLRLDPMYSKYFKMLSIGLPMEAVKHAMARDGLDSSVMDQDHNLPAITPRKPVEETQKEKDSHRRARLHWKTLRKVTSNSLWAKIDQDDALDNIEIDEQEFQELFQAERSASLAAKTKKSDTAKKGATVRVIDPKRANNGGIILARLKMSHDDMADAVDKIDDNAMTLEQIEHMIEYLPTKEERKALEAYMLGGGQDAAEKFDGLCECEKFMVSMMTVKHAKRKVRALLFKLQFESCVKDIQQDAFLVEGACDELINSVRLRQLLGIILVFGNRLNTAGNGKQKAGAFTLDSLLKLNQAKAFDKKTTFLNYLILIVQRNNELLLRFKDDLPTVFKAGKVFWDQCVGDLEEVENQLENVRRISLYQARQALGYRLRRKNKHREEDEESLSDGEISLSLEEEVEALRATPVGMFTLSAIKYISALRDKVEETKRKFTHLLEYFGEEDKKLQPHELFSIIVSFSRDFDKAKEQAFTSQKKKQREERKRQASSSKVGKPPQYSPAPRGRREEDSTPVRASNLQPNLSKVLSELRTSRGNNFSKDQSFHDEAPVSPARTDNFPSPNKQIAASPARSDSIALRDASSAGVSANSALARSSFRHKRRLEQRRLRKESSEAREETD